MQVDGLSLNLLPIISKKCMNEDSVALIMCEKCVYRIRILKKDLELSVDSFLKDTSCLKMPSLFQLAGINDSDQLYRYRVSLMCIESSQLDICMI